VRRRAGGLEAPALVDRHVDEDGAAAHDPELLPGDHVRRPRAVDEHRADDHVRVGQALLDLERGGEDGLGAAAEGDVELAQAVEVAVEDRDARLHADRDEGGVHADHAAADDEHVGAGDAGNAAHEHAAAPERLLEHEGAGLRGDLARHLAHRGQQRQPPARVGDRLVGHAGGARLHEPRVSSGSGARCR
jgi:hypothetical protein